MKLPGRAFVGIFSLSIGPDRMLMIGNSRSAPVGGPSAVHVFPFGAGSQQVACQMDTAILPVLNLNFQVADTLAVQMASYTITPVTDTISPINLVINRISYSCITATEPLHPQPRFGAYPNPSAGVLYLEGLVDGVEYRIRLLDALGRLVQECRHRGGQAIHLDGLESGLYRLEASQGRDRHSTLVLINSQ
jgi:hypothetical protein